MSASRLGVLSKVIAGALTSVSLPAVAQIPPASTPKTISVSQVFPYLDAYLKLPPAERTLFTVGYYLRQGGAPAPGVPAVLSLGPERHVLKVDAYGRILPLPTVAEFRSGLISFTASSGPSFSVAVKPLASLPLTAQFRSVDLYRAIRQGDAGMHKAAGMQAVLLPELARAIFVDGGSGQAVHADGSMTALPGGDRPYYEPTSMPGVASVRLAHPPSAILLHSADDKGR